MHLFDCYLRSLKSSSFVNYPPPLPPLLQIATFTYVAYNKSAARLNEPQPQKLISVQPSAELSKPQNKSHSNSSGTSKQLRRIYQR